VIKSATYTTKILERRWLSQGTFELICGRPASFAFAAGQKLRVAGPDGPREYSIVSAPTETTLDMCIRKIDGGRISTALSRSAIGSALTFSGPFGYFNYRPSERQAVFVATGTGIAPFVCMSRAGIRDYILLHGVRQMADLYYRSELEAAACRYIPCLSNAAGVSQNCFHGRVTEFLKTKLAQADYDFYLCGSGRMIRDCVLLVDERFDRSLIFTEKFY
jgi:ferredoxin-NADP reductase